MTTRSKTPQPDLTDKSSVEKYLSDCRDLLSDELLRGISGSELNEIATDQYDLLLKDLFKKNVKDLGLVSLVAIGGYGKKEMAPYSDVDLLLLHEHGSSDVVSVLTNEMIYPLWNSKIEATLVTRTIDECWVAAKNDVRSLTSMIDSRFLAGDEVLYKRYYDRFQALFSSRVRSNKYIQTKYAEYKNRLKRYGDSVFVSEPHIKEGEGGLRCYHAVLWILRARYGTNSIEALLRQGIIDQRSYQEWTTALDFIWRVRQCLHLLARRKQDRLDYTYQEQVARQLGFVKDDVKSGLEEFMHNFYKHAAYIYSASDRLIGIASSDGVMKRVKKFFGSRRITKDIYKVGGEIFITQNDRGVVDTDIALSAWQFSHRTKLSLSDEAKELIRKSLPTWDTCAHKVHNIFREIIKDPVGLDNVLLEMHETGVLYVLFPEFKALHHLVQYDAYHLYTVDIHTIFLVREISKLASKENKDRYQDIYNDVLRPDILVMAGLLHDIGKGRHDTRGHEQIGAEMSRDIAGRFGFDDQETSVIELLVRSHLILPQLAFCRDIEDHQLIENLAQSIKTEDNLRMLYLLTYADIRATGPELWSSWKAELLSELFSKAFSFMSGSGYTDKNIKEQFLKKESEFASRFEKKDAEISIAWLHDMPMRYILSSSVETIAHDLKRLRSLKNEKHKMDVQRAEERTYHNITIYTKDSPGLFSKICAAFTSHGISILEAQLYTGKKGDVVDLFKVVRADGRPVQEDLDWGDVSEVLEKLLSGTLSEDEIVHRRSSERRTEIRQRRAGQRSEVIIDNDVSANYTVVEIHAGDRVGLLYAIAHWFYKNDYNIYLAKVMTQVGEAIDIFYIKDITGNKVSLKDDLQVIKKELKELL